MLKSVMVAALLLGLTSHVGADNRTVWKGVFVGSMAMAVGGGTLWWTGTNDVETAREALCDGGAYSNDASCSTQLTLTASQVDALNDSGDRGSMRSQIGAATTLIGLGVGTYAFYKGFIQKDTTEPSVVVSPVLTRGGGGAALHLSW